MKWMVPALAVLLAACSFGASTAAGDKMVATFHQQFNAHDYQNILATAGPEIKADPRMQMIFSLIDSRLGAVKSSERTGFNEQLNTAGHFLNLGYRTTFAKGMGQETFTFRIIDGRTELAGYNIDSPMLLNPSGPTTAAPRSSPSPATSR